MGINVLILLVGAESDPNLILIKDATEAFREELEGIGDDSEKGAEIYERLVSDPDGDLEIVDIRIDDQPSSPYEIHRTFTIWHE